MSALEKPGPYLMIVCSDTKYSILINISGYVYDMVPGDLQPKIFSGRNIKKTQDNNINVVGQSMQLGY